MNSETYKMLKAVRRYKNLNKIIQKTGVSDYLKLQEVADYDNLLFSDNRMDENTVIKLSPEGLERFEDYRRVSRGDLKSTIALILSGIAIASEIFFHLIK